MKKIIISIAVLMVLIITEYSHAQDTSCGIVWEPPIQLSPDSIEGYTPSIALQGDTVHITWWNSGLHYPYVRSTNGGQTFEPLREIAQDSVGFVSKCIIASDGSRLHAFFAATQTTPPYSYYHMYSDDNGYTWFKPEKYKDLLIVYSFTGRNETVVLRTSKPNQFYLLTKSLDGGITWQTDTCNMLSGNYPKLALTKNYLHLVKGSGFDSAGIWSEFVIQYRRSTDLGKTWSDSIPISTVNGTTAYDPYMAAYDQGDSSKLFVAWRDTKYGCLTMVGCAILGRRSNDNGTSFLPEERFDGRPAGFLPATAIRGKIRVITWNDDLPDGGLLSRISLDDGLTWCEPYMIGKGGIQDIKISKGIIHVVWEECIQRPNSTCLWSIFYRRGIILPTSVNDGKEEIPKQFELSQNYPNPFNGLTLVNFQLPINSWVTLEVYDILGQEIATLVNEMKHLGKYEVTWDASNVPSGVYIIRMNAGKYFSTTKAILMK